MNGLIGSIVLAIVNPWAVAIGAIGALFAYRSVAADEADAATGRVNLYCVIARHRDGSVVRRYVGSWNAYQAGRTARSQSPGLVEILSIEPIKCNYQGPEDWPVD